MSPILVPSMPPPLSVRRFLEQLKARIEPAGAGVTLVGEVSNARTSGRHWYFTLKEEGAALQCAVWASQQRSLKVQPRDGMKVVVQGSLSLYVPGGSLTFAVTQCEPVGVGDLQARLRQLEAELRAEGVFDRPRRPLPRFPKRIAVVAALGGAALRDVLEVTRRRAPGLDIRIFPATAQGERCVGENLLMLQEAQDPFWACDVILLVRGGGSLEDLWGFNDPDLVRAVAECRIPIVTGVGHEIDTTLVDLAADLRAATPSQAAELATPDLGRLQGDLMRLREALIRQVEWRVQGRETTLNLLVDRGLLRLDPLDRVQRRLDGLLRRLEGAHPQRRLDKGATRLALLRQRLLHAAARVARSQDLPRLAEAGRRLDQALGRTLERRGRQLEVLEARLLGVRPDAPLSRGFVLVTDASGRPVTSAASAPEGERLDLRWQDGVRKARLEGGPSEETGDAAQG